MSIKISIITVTLNSQRYLSHVIKSIADQEYDNIEYIIVDGESGDDTINIIKKNEQHIDAWISEPDAGIADAMNKGVELATGDYILFLHSDDFLPEQNSISKAVDEIKKRPDFDVYAFSIAFQTGRQQEIRHSHSWNVSMYFMNHIRHQGMLCRKEQLEALNGFDIEFAVSMDYDLNLRMYLQGTKVLFVRDVLAVMRDTGVSSRIDWSSLRHRFADDRKVHKKNCPNNIMAAVYTLYWSDTFFLINSYKLHLIKGGCIYHKGL